MNPTDLNQNLNSESTTPATSSTLPSASVGPIDPNSITPVDPDSIKDVEPTSEQLSKLEASAESEPPVKEESDLTSDEGAGGANVYKEKVKEKSVGLVEMPNMNSGEGINLIPTLTEQEILLEKQKSGVNYLAVFVALFIALLSVAIVGFNFINRGILRSEQEELTQLEGEVRKHSTSIASNNAILQRVELYEAIQQSTFSPKSVFIYWLELSNEFGEIDKIELSGGLDFSFDGEAEDLIDAARLWHLLSVDPRVEEIELESISKTESGVNYRFTGRLDFEYFLINRESQSETSLKEFENSEIAVLSDQNNK